VTEGPAEIAEVVGLAVPQGEPRRQVGAVTNGGAPLRQLFFPKHAFLRVVWFTRRLCAGVLQRANNNEKI
jgi:hypothetical protein